MRGTINNSRKLRKMFFIATITDKDNAPAIRRQLKRAGFGYIPRQRTWVLNSMSKRGARHDLPKVRAIQGIRFTMRTPEEHTANIEKQIAIRAGKAAA